MKKKITKNKTPSSLSKQKTIFLVASQTKTSPKSPPTPTFPKLPPQPHHQAQLKQAKRTWEQKNLHDVVFVAGFCSCVLLFFFFFTLLFSILLQSKITERSISIHQQTPSKSLGKANSIKLTQIIKETNFVCSGTILIFKSIVKFMVMLVTCRSRLP